MNNKPKKNKNSGLRIKNGKNDDLRNNKKINGNGKKNIIVATLKEKKSNKLNKKFSGKESRNVSKRVSVEESGRDDDEESGSESEKEEENIKLSKTGKGAGVRAGKTKIKVAAGGKGVSTDKDKNKEKNSGKYKNDKENSGKKKDKDSIDVSSRDVQPQLCPFDAVIFLGDLNYRLNLPRLEVRARSYSGCM